MVYLVDKGEGFFILLVKNFVAVAFRRLPNVLEYKALALSFGKPKGLHSNSIS
jgi:hypothetical protein